MRFTALLTAAFLFLCAAAHAADPPTVPEPPPGAAQPENLQAAPAVPSLPAVPPPAAVPPPGAAPPEQAPPAAAAPPVQPPPVAETRPAPPPAKAAGASPEKPGASPVYLSMDFTDVELPVLIKFMSEQTRKNFIFDERVQGKITIISPRKVTVDEAYNVFLSVLQVKGFTTVEQGNTIKIVAAREARQDTIPTGETHGMPGAEFITRLIPLQYLDSAEVVPLITPLVSKDGLVSAFGSSNTLLLIDSRSNVDRLFKILSELDVEGTPGNLKVFHLTYASAADTAKTLDSLFQESPSATPTRGRPRGISRRRGVQTKFIPEARTNSLIVFATEEVLGEVANLVQQLDVPVSAGAGKINVYYLENADAEEVAKVLASLSEKRPGQQPTPVATPVMPGARQPTVKDVLSAELEGGVKVTPDKATNSLIIVASPNDYQTLVDVVKKLDIRRRQVYVQAVIMEVTLNKERDLGAEFRGAVQTGGSNGAVLSGTNFGFTGGVNDLFTALATGNPLVLSGTGLIAGGIAGNVTLPNGTKIPAVTAILRAAQTASNVNILSSPHLLTLDNKEAEIIVGQNVPFITSQSRDTTNLANVINTVERKDVGITLRLTPHIHESDFVSLELYQESSAIVGDTLLNTSQVGPTTTKRSAKTSVLVKNGDTVVLGGMMQETYTTTNSQVPLLGDIPLLGNLFKFKSVQRQKTNLLILLTPQIIREPGQMAPTSQEQQKKMTEDFNRQKKEVESTFPDPNPERKP